MPGCPRDAGQSNNVSNSCRPPCAPSVKVNVKGCTRCPCCNKSKVNLELQVADSQRRKCSTLPVNFDISKQVEEVIGSAGSENPPCVVKPPPCPCPQKPSCPAKCVSSCRATQTSPFVNSNYEQDECTPLSNTCSTQTACPKPECSTQTHPCPKPRKSKCNSRPPSASQSHCNSRDPTPSASRCNSRAPTPRTSQLRFSSPPEQECSVPPSRPSSQNLCQAQTPPKRPCPQPYRPCQPPPLPLPPPRDCQQFSPCPSSPQTSCSQPRPSAQCCCRSRSQSSSVRSSQDSTAGSNKLSKWGKEREAKKKISCSSSSELSCHKICCPACCDKSEPNECDRSKIIACSKCKQPLCLNVRIPMCTSCHSSKGFECQTNKKNDDNDYCNENVGRVSSKPSEIHRGDSGVNGCGCEKRDTVMTCVKNKKNWHCNCSCLSCEAKWRYNGGKSLKSATCEGDCPSSESMLNYFRKSLEMTSGTEGATERKANYPCCKDQSVTCTCLRVGDDIECKCTCMACQKTWGRKYDA